MAFGEDNGNTGSVFGYEGTKFCCVGELEITFAVILTPSLVDVAYEGTVTVDAKTKCMPNIPCEGRHSDGGTCASWVSGKNAEEWPPPGGTAAQCSISPTNPDLLMCTMKKYEKLGCCDLGCSDQTNSKTYQNVTGVVPKGDTYGDIREGIDARFGFGGSEYNEEGENTEDPKFPPCCTASEGRSTETPTGGASFGT
jgi:hypothetical protein